jgi:hypothetical protein
VAGSLQGEAGRENGATGTHIEVKVIGTQPAAVATRSSRVRRRWSACRRDASWRFWTTAGTAVDEQGDSPVRLPLPPLLALRPRTSMSGAGCPRPSTACRDSPRAGDRPSDTSGSTTSSRAAMFSPLAREHASVPLARARFLVHPHVPLPPGAGRLERDTGLLSQMLDSETLPFEPDRHQHLACPTDDVPLRSLLDLRPRAVVRPVGRKSFDQSV